MNYKLLVQYTKIVVAIGVPQDQELSLLQGTFDHNPIVPMDDLLKQLTDVKAVLDGTLPAKMEDSIGAIDPFGYIDIQPDITRYVSEDYGLEQVLPTPLYYHWFEQFVRFATVSANAYPKHRKAYNELGIPMGEDWGIWFFMRMENDQVTTLYATLNRPGDIKLEYLFNEKYAYSHYVALLDDVRQALRGTIPTEGRNDIQITAESVIIEQEENRYEIPLPVCELMLEDWLWFIHTVQQNFNCRLFKENEA
ncbi:hypothetical protein [Chitinophaga varians]|uniref:hypothetical protein n=1 Tax=Chitinophaga varians TaxID=2202339 RepID=UPI00165F19B6|nr:hypothetical protein [Chitinophaga varians]MBC9909887.1 hypothetical protein [Chitinophaga varians]